MWELYIQRHYITVEDFAIFDRRLSNQIIDGDF